MKTRSIGCSVLSLVFVFLASLASAKELKSDELNYVITVPDGWTLTFQNSAGFSIASPDGKKTMTLLRRKVRSAKLDPKSIAEFEQGLLKAGSQKISSRMFTIDGIPAYETINRIGRPPFASVMINQMIIADNKLYMLHAMHGGGDITQDSEVQASLGSFHFLLPPKPPAPSGAGGIISLGWKLAIPVVIVLVGVFLGVIRKRAA